MTEQSTANDTDYENLKQEAKSFYSKVGRIFSPAFNQKIHFNPDGFHHLVRKDGRIERDRREQTLRFMLFPLAVKLIEISTTYQEYEQQVKGFEVMTGKGRVIQNKPVRFDVKLLFGKIRSFYLADKSTRMEVLQSWILCQERINQPFGSSFSGPWAIPAGISAARKALQAKPAWGLTMSIKRSGNIPN